MIIERHDGSRERFRDLTPDQVKVLTSRAADDPEVVAFKVWRQQQDQQATDDAQRNNRKQRRARQEELRRTAKRLRKKHRRPVPAP